MTREAGARATNILNRERQRKINAAASVAMTIRFRRGSMEKGKRLLLKVEIQGQTSTRVFPILIDKDTTQNDFDKEVQDRHAHLLQMESAPKTTPVIATPEIIPENPLKAELLSKLNQEIDL